MVKYAQSLLSFLNLWFISQQTKPYYLVEKGSSCILPHHDFVYAHTLYIHTKFLSLVVQLGKNKYENLNTVCKETVKQWSRVALSVCFTHLMPLKSSHLIEKIFLANNPNIFQSLHAHAWIFLTTTASLVQMHHQLFTWLNHQTFVFSQNFRD